MLVFFVAHQITSLVKYCHCWTPCEQSGITSMASKIYLTNFQVTILLNIWRARLHGGGCKPSSGTPYNTFRLNIYSQNSGTNLAWGRKYDWNFFPIFCRVDLISYNCWEYNWWYINVFITLTDHSFESGLKCARHISSARWRPK